MLIQRSFAILALAAVAACSTSSPDVIQRDDAQRLSQVQDGTVLSVRNVKVDGSQSGGGAVVGGVAGGVAGAGVGGGRGSTVTGVLAAVAGAVVGNAIERSATSEDAVELIIQLRNGDRRSVVQSKGSETLLAGDSVLLVSTGGKTRVTKAPVIVTPAAPMGTAPAPVPSS